MITRKRCPLCTHEDRSQLEADLESMSYTTDTLDQQMNWPSGTSSRHQRNHMGNYTNSSNPRCKLCVNPIRNELEEQLHDGNMTPAGAANIVGCSEDQVVRHMKSHLQPLVQESAAQLIAKKEVDEIDTFKGKLVHKRQDTIIVHQMQIVKEVLAQNHPEVWLDVRNKMQEKLQ